MNYLVFAAMQEDLNAGWIRVSQPEVSQRAVVRITNRDSNMSVYCEALTIDDNFLEKYNQGRRHHIQDGANAIVLNEWYRKRLGGLQTQTDYALSVSIEDHIFGHLRSCLHHPQIVVRLATRLALISVGLGAIGIVLGALSLKCAT